MIGHHFHKYDPSQNGKTKFEQLLDIFRDTADYWADRKIPFRCFYSFAVARSQPLGAWDRAGAEGAPLENAVAVPPKPAPKVPVAKGGFNPNFGMNMPLMSRPLLSTSAGRPGMMRGT